MDRLGPQHARKSVTDEAHLGNPDCHWQLNAKVETTDDTLADKARLDDLMERLKAQIESTPSQGFPGPVAVGYHRRGVAHATPYAADRIDYSNWELSADRSNAARREMIAGGMDPHKFGRVVGLADGAVR